MSPRKSALVFLNQPYSLDGNLRAETPNPDEFY
jgi:hypothetical protein